MYIYDDDDDDDDDGWWYNIARHIVLLIVMSVTGLLIGVSVAIGARRTKLKDECTRPTSNIEEYINAPGA